MKTEQLYRSLSFQDLQEMGLGLNNPIKEFKSKWSVVCGLVWTQI